MKIYILFLIFSIKSFSQESAPFVLDHADELIGKTIKGETVRELKGNVSFHQGSLKVKCDNAIHYITRNELELFGNVNMFQDSINLKSEKAFYNTLTKSAKCEIKVELIKGLTTVYSEFANYDVDKKIGRFFPTVKIISKKDDAIITGNEAEFNDKLKSLKIFSNAKLVQLIPLDNTIDTLAIKSSTMESINEGDLLIAKGNVLLARNKFASSSNEIYFDKINETIDYFNNPILWYEKNQISGDTIKIKLKNNKLQKMDIARRAFAITMSDSNYENRFNQMTGNLMKINFYNDTIKNIIVYRNGISLYYIYDENLPNGVNVVSGDEVISDFKNGIIDKINIKKGVEGIYTPEKILNRDISKGFLDGFKLNKNRPTINSIINDKSFSNLK
ncbi:MAG: hypothetical protein O3A55_05995 [Bacteroidetes bacterium]|nr:hypothetical protein [Bacteroidota bacterium]